MMTLSAGIVTYNEKEEVLDRVLGCFAGIEVPKELVIVDNSPDQSLQAVAHRYAFVHYHHSRQNLGFGAGHNLAYHLRKTDSDLHCVINPDTWFDPIQLQTMAQWHSGHPEIAVSVPRVLNPDGSVQYVCRNIPTPKMMLLRRLNIGGVFDRYVVEDELGHTVHQDVYDVPFCHGCFLMFQSRSFKQLDGFDQRFFLYMEDADIFIRAKAFGRTVQNPRFEIYHEYRQGSAKSPTLLWEHVRSAWKFFKKHGCS